MNLLFVGAGGCISAILRYLIGLIPIGNSNGFPVNTFIINAAGAFAIGIISALSAKYADFDPKIILFLKTGICGGFTTFSTFSLESFELLESGSALTGILYMLSTVVFCILAVLLAHILIR